MSTPTPEWHDVAEQATTGRPLWVFLDDDAHHFSAIEMGTWGETNGWRSALNREVEFAPDQVKAWAEVDYPSFPLRRWEATPIGRTGEQS